MFLRDGDFAFKDGVLWNVFKRVTTDFSAAEKALLFHDTAARVYRVNAGLNQT